MRREGKTVVFVSHNRDVVRKFCDRVLLLDGGQAVAVGAANEIVDLYERRAKEQSAQAV
jgi:teichoic acid transport system ATP-binding protein